MAGQSADTDPRLTQPSAGLYLAYKTKYENINTDWRQICDHEVSVYDKHNPAPTRFYV